MNPEREKKSGTLTEKCQLRLGTTTYIRERNAGPSKGKEERFKRPGEGKMKSLGRLKRKYFLCNRLPRKTEPWLRLERPQARC